VHRTACEVGLLAGPSRQPGQRWVARGEAHHVEEGGHEVGRKVSQGTERWVEVLLHPTPEEAIHALTQQSFTLVATHPKGELLPEDLPGIERLCLVVGNEHDGISQALVGAAASTVRVPMRGFVESLNLSVACALLLRAATLGRPADLDAAERRLLYAAGLVRSVPRAEEILTALASAG
jgi:tRNA (guanosine-2'-O-)-methyltransferase